jgi:hypothetical protein
MMNRVQPRKKIDSKIYQGNCKENLEQVGLPQLTWVNNKNFEGMEAFSQP